MGLGGTKVLQDRWINDLKNKICLAIYFSGTVYSGFLLEIRVGGEGITSAYIYAMEDTVQYSTVQIQLQ